ncbi:MAG: hypothetical protein OEZ20_08330 [candidate division WOR-3 bacterium]|nr:hypothetical protein [candidate division WOR-3 bacterium]
MLYVLLFTILSFSLSFSDTVEVKGTRGLYYRAFVNQDTLYFQYKTGSKWSDLLVIDNGDVASPSMAISSGGYLHIVWCKRGGVYYKTNLEPITKNSLKNKINTQWSSKVKISTPMSQTEHASDIFVETLADTVFIEWHSLDELGKIKEKWRRKRWVLRPYYEWYQPVNFTLLKDTETKLK